MLVGKQQKSMDKLKYNLLEIVGTHRVIFEEADNENNYIECGFVVMKTNAIGMIKDCGLFYQNMFEELHSLVQNDVCRGVAKFVLSLVIGIEGIEKQNDSSTCYKVALVLPYELVELCGYEFNEIVAKKSRLFLYLKTRKELEILQEQHRELIFVYRSEDPLRDAIQKSKSSSTFEDGWKYIGSERFEVLKEFCGGLATVFLVPPLLNLIFQS